MGGEYKIGSCRNKLEGYWLESSGWGQESVGGLLWTW